MAPVALVLALWAIMLVTHIGLAIVPVRWWLVTRLGERGFIWVYTAVAVVAFTALSAGYAGVRDQGPPGLDLGDARVGDALAGAIVAGFVLMGGALSPGAYWSSPAVVFGDGVRDPRGLERVTRHPFFTGLVLVMGAHSLLAARLTGTVMFAGFVVLATVGAAHQGRKLRVRRGPDYDRYLATTSAVPFAAIVRRRQRLVPGELPWLAMALGAGAAAAVRVFHDHLFAWHGAPFAVAIGGGAVVIGVIATALARRRAKIGG